VVIALCGWVESAIDEMHVSGPGSVRGLRIISWNEMKATI